MKTQTVKAGTAKLQPYFDEWASLAQQREDARTNNNFSDAGKRQVYQRIEAARALLRDNAVEAFTKEYASQQRAMEANNKARGAALDVSLARWANLKGSIDTEANRVQGMVKNGKPVDEMVREWKDARNSVVMVNGWYLGLQAATGGNSGTRALQMEVNREFEAMRTTPELEKINTRGRALEAAAIMLRDDTIQFMNLLMRVFGLSREGATLQNLLPRIKVTTQANGMGFVEFVDSPADELETEVLTFGG